LARRQIALASTFATLGLTLPAVFLRALLCLATLTLRRLLALVAGRLTARHLLLR
jgi:hypothetical protein